jgi:hypothetical protein
MAKDPLPLLFCQPEKKESLKCDKIFIPENISKKNVKIFSKK